MQLEHSSSLEQKVDHNDKHYQEIFDDAHVALWVEDFSEVVVLLDKIRAEGVSDLRSYFRNNPAILGEAVDRLRVLNVNAYAVEMFEAEDKATLLNSLPKIFLPETEQVFIDELLCIWEGRSRLKAETVLQTLKGRKLTVTFTIAFNGDNLENALVSILDISDRKVAEIALVEQTRRLETFNHIAHTIAADLDLESIVQRVVDAGKELSGAQYGAFFYNRVDQDGEHFLLYALSGAPRAAFEKFDVPRNTELFHPTFQGQGIIRSADIHSDPRYGKTPPHFGMPNGHLPVVSYLAAPVISRSGEVLGSLFFGHGEPGVFSEATEKTVAAVAAHAAVAIDNARLLESARMELEQRRRADRHAQHFKALVESSEDAIISKDLDGIITSWNPGAEKLFGHKADDVIGLPITILIPQDRQDEEPEILARIRSGQHVHHYETVRQRKDGSLVDISLTISPIKDQDGHIIGASKIARDISDRKIAEQQQQLMLHEMNHRVVNLFSLVSSMIASSARMASTAEELGDGLRERLNALARAHALTLSGGEYAPPGSASQNTLQTLIRTILLPYDDQPGEDRITIRGIDAPVSGRFITNLALLLYEFATNAAKYGALSATDGRIDIECRETPDGILLTWKESGGPVVGEPAQTGFGTRLVKATTASLGGNISHEWIPAGLTIHLSFPRPD